MLYPQQNIFIKPLTQILIQINISEFDQKVALLDQDYHPIQQRTPPTFWEGKGMIITLNQKPEKTLVIRYKNTTLDWEPLKFKVEKGQELSSNSSLSLKIKKIIDHPSEIQVKLENNLLGNEALSYEGYPIQYRIETQEIKTLFNNGQPIIFHSISENPAIIETNELVKEIRNEINVKIGFREIKRRNEIWIHLVEPTNFDSSNEDTISKLDIFFDFLFSGYNIENFE